MTVLARCPDEAKQHAQGWTLSVLLHGLAISVAILLVADFTLAPPPEPFRWEVSMVEAPPAEQIDTPTPAPSQPVPPPVQAAPRPVRQATQDVSPIMEATRDAPPQTVPEATTESVPAFEPQPVTAPQEPDHPFTPAMPSELPVRATPTTPVDYGWLANALWKRIEQLKRYPHLARMNQWEGKVVLRVVIRDDGQLLDLKLEESSGHAVLDRDALETVRQASPLTLTRPLGQPQMVMHVPISYKLDQ